MLRRWLGRIFYGSDNLHLTKCSYENHANCTRRKNDFDACLHPYCLQAVILYYKDKYVSECKNHENTKNIHSETLSRLLKIPQSF